MNNQLNQNPEYNKDVIGAVEKKENTYNSVKSHQSRFKNLIFGLGMLTAVGTASGVVNPDKANATISACGDTISCIAAESSEGSEGTIFINTANKNVEGTLTGETGVRETYSKDGHIVITTNSGARIVDVATGTSCSIANGGGKPIMHNNSIYIPHGGLDQVREYDFSCNNLRQINTGWWPVGITTDGTHLFVLNSLDANITQIDPITGDATNYDIGATMADTLYGITYNDGHLYVSDANSVRKSIVPGYNNSSFVTMPEQGENIVSNNSHLLIEGSDAAYLTRISDQSINTLPTTAAADVAINSDQAFVSSTFGADKGVKRFDLNGNYIDMLTTTGTYAITYLPAQNPVTDICDGVERTGNETCDGTFLNGTTCENLGFDGGTLTCAPDCNSYNTSACTTETCGDGTTNGTEICDETDLNGNDCTTIGQGFIGGTLACNPDCNSYDMTSCVTQECGDENIDGDEACDGANVNNETCITLGYASGTLECAADCDSLNTTGCVPEADCGNGTINDGEVCDGTNLNETTCETLGYASGNLACADSCAEFDETGCENAPDPVCGNDITEAGEDCDDGNTIDGDGCSATCTTEVEVCEFTDDTELTIETAEDIQQVDTNQLVGILLDRYNGNLEDLQRECKVECIMDPIVDIPIIQITTPDGSYCNFKLVTGEKGDTFYNEQIYQLHDVNVGDGEGAVFGFNRESSYNNALDAGGLILVHSGRQVKTNIVSALGGGTLGTVVAYELHAEHEGVQAEWVQLVIGDGGIRFSHPETPDEYRDVYFNNDADNTDPVVIWFNLTEFKKSRNLDESLFPTSIRDPKEPDCVCSTPGLSPNGEAPTAIISLAFLLAAALRKKKKNGEIVDNDENEANEASE